MSVGDITGNGATVIWLTGTVGEGTFGVGGPDGWLGCALPAIFHASGWKAFGIGT